MELGLLRVNLKVLGANPGSIKYCLCSLEIEIHVYVYSDLEYAKACLTNLWIAGSYSVFLDVKILYMCTPTLGKGEIGCNN